MPEIPITMPQLGESIAEATVVALKVKPGDKVVADQEIIEVETNKAVMSVTTPCAGEIKTISAQVKETYPIGAVLGYVDGSEKDAEKFQKNAPTAPAESVAAEVPGRDEDKTKPREMAQVSNVRSNGRTMENRGTLPVPARTKGAAYFSPRVRARMAELQLTQADLAGILGSGAAGRVTVKDLENFLQGVEKQSPSNASAIRVGVADAMRRSWTRPLATIGSSVCLDPLLNDRKQRDPKPGPALYALRAMAIALAENPMAAARLIGNRVVQSPSIDVGVAVEAEDGIMVPIIRGADKTSLAELTKRYTELVALARQRRLGPELTSGGIAAVSNFGTFGVEWGTPIPLPDQALLLGLGAGKKVPSWDEGKGQFIPRTEAQLTLSFDHRSLDGGGAGRLLKRIMELLAAPQDL